jgi:hypothetical protein
VLSRPLPETDSYKTYSKPMAGSRTTLYWWQRRGVEPPRPVLTTYDLGTGRLHELFPHSTGAWTDVPYFGMSATADKIVNWPIEEGQTCTADVLDAKSGERVARLRPAIAHCADVYFALSPDDRRVAALVTSRDGGAWRQRVISVDAATGAVQKEFRTPPLAKGADLTRLVSGLDWVDDRTLAYARGVVPAPAQAGSDPTVMTFKL